jgi:hypothetical protein
MRRYTNVPSWTRGIGRLGRYRDAASLLAAALPTPPWQ